MDPSAIRIARRLVHEMLQCANEQLDLHMFMGIGIGLAFCYEEMTGRTAKDKKPQELMQWALGLPDERYRRVDPT